MTPQRDFARVRCYGFALRPVLHPSSSPDSPRIAIVSPHRGDAAFSCGILLRTCVERKLQVDIWNLFTVSNWPPEDSSEEPGAAARARQAEDSELSEELGSGVRIRDMQMPDAALRLGMLEADVRQPLSAETHARQLVTLLPRMGELRGYDIVCIPLALGGDADHVLARDAGLELVQRNRLWVYEDLPYACHATEDAFNTQAAELGLEAAQGWMQTILTLEDGSDSKASLAGLYPLQAGREVVGEIRRHSEAMGNGERYLVHRGFDAVVLAGFSHQALGNA